MDVKPGGLDVQANEILLAPPFTETLSCEESPIQIIDGEALIFVIKNAVPTTVTVTCDVFEHPVVTSVTVNVNVVVVDKATVVGLNTFGFINKAAGTHVYVKGPAPPAEPFNVMLVPFIIEIGGPAFATGAGIIERFVRIIP